MCDASVTDVSGSTPNESLSSFLAISRALRLVGLRARGGLMSQINKTFPGRVVLKDTSYTEPCILQVEVGAAWVALGYTKVNSRKRGPE